ncbi:MAG: HAD family phosphatase [Clostridia bacterium]|nr:HAD family phosphatase [Clostridia bacterium]
MKKFENIILASDIDGTFVWQYGEVSPKNYEKIRYFIENGGHFLFSSGRNTKDICVVGEGLLSLVNTPCVLCNGALLYDVRKDVIENPVYVDTADMVALLTDADEKFPDVGFRASYEGGFIVREGDDYIRNELTKYDTVRFATFVSLPDFNKYKFFKTIFRAPAERVAEVADYIIPKYSDRFAFTRSSVNILEVMPQGVTKATQLKYLKEKMKKDYHDATLWCVGDFDNDVDMLRFADVAACPANSTDAVKAICSVHLCHCKDGAVGELIDVIEERLK